MKLKTGCMTCRARKVKCDERPGVCVNCQRLGIPCQRKPDTENDTAGSVTATTLAGTKRKRTFRSCRACRASKARCSGEQPSCARCLSRQTMCVYATATAPKWTRSIQSLASNVVLQERHDHQKLVDPLTEHSTTSDRAQENLYSSGSEFENLADSVTQQCESVVTTPAQSSATAFDMYPRSLQTLPIDSGQDSLAWLFTPRLPGRQRVRMLVKEYFDNIHPLRCYGFVHRPSFIQRLDESSTDDHDKNALLHVMCAQGAKFYALQYTSSLEPLSPRAILAAGNAWARKAQNLLLADLGAISVQNLMTTVLLHDHELRTGNYAAAFMLTGIMTRMVHALQLNAEYSTNLFRDEPNHGPSVCSKEARRRLMWSCYSIDVLVGCGADRLTLLPEDAIKVQLPCSERNFALQLPCVTEMLQEGQFLPFITKEAIPPRVIDNIGIVALYIRLLRLRKQVLTYIRQLETSGPPWRPDSEFSKLDTALHNWYDKLPPSLQFTRAALYTRRESSQLGAFVLLQCTYNWTIVDLYRIALPKLYRLQIPWQCDTEFSHRLQQTIFIHARRCSIVLADAARHGTKTLADTWLPTIAFDANRLMLYYITSLLGLGTDAGKTAFLECMPYFRSNIELLRLMQSITAIAEVLYPLADTMLKKASSLPEHQATEDGSASSHTRTREATPDITMTEYDLQPVSIYKMARDSIPDQEKHASEHSRTKASGLQPNCPSTDSPTARGFPMSHGPVNTNHFNFPQRQQAPERNILPDAHSSVQMDFIQLDPLPSARQDLDAFFASERQATSSHRNPEQTADSPAVHADTSWRQPDIYTDIGFAPWPIGNDFLSGIHYPPT